MVFLHRALALIVPFTGLFHAAVVTASPLENIGDMKLANHGIIKRQDPGPEGPIDPSGIEPEDEDPAQIAADGTEQLRKAVPARALYTDQPTATWYQVATLANDASASFTVFATTGPENSIPKPDDENQVRGPNPWNVDHIFELQVIGEAFKSAKPSSIPQTDWASASSAVFTAGAPNKAIASAVTNLKNLQGIPNALNSFKKQVFTGNLTGKGGPSSGDGATFFSFYGPAIQKYLQDNKDSLLSDTVDRVGNEIKSAGGNNDAIKTYFTSYASLHYQGCIDFLSTWNGRTLDRTSATSTSAPATAQTTAAASVTCVHAADPQNTCEAIADSKGWCDCGDFNKYIVQTGLTNICGWTTLPPTTTFDCATTPTSACDVPAGCTNEAAPTGCAVACT